MSVIVSQLPIPYDLVRQLCLQKSISKLACLTVMPPLPLPPSKCGQIGGELGPPHPQTLNSAPTSLHCESSRLPIAHPRPTMALCRPIRAPSIAALAVLESALANFRISAPNALQRVAIPRARLAGGLRRSDGGRRLASHQAQGRANGAADGPGKRLGAKKTAGEYVVPGNILYKQRGTLWFPGDGCHMVIPRSPYGTVED